MNLGLGLSVVRSSGVGTPVLGPELVPAANDPTTWSKSNMTVTPLTVLGTPGWTFTDTSAGAIGTATSATFPVTVGKRYRISFDIGQFNGMVGGSTGYLGPLDTPRTFSNEALASFTNSGVVSAGPFVWTGADTSKSSLISASGPDGSPVKRRIVEATATGTGVAQFLVLTGLANANVNSIWLGNISIKEILAGGGGVASVPLRFLTSPGSGDVRDLAVGIEAISNATNISCPPTSTQVYARPLANASFNEVLIAAGNMKGHAWQFPDFGAGSPYRLCAGAITFGLTSNLSGGVGSRNILWDIVLVKVTAGGAYVSELGRAFTATFAQSTSFLKNNVSVTIPDSVDFAAGERLRVEVHLSTSTNAGAQVVYLITGGVANESEMLAHPNYIQL